MVAIDQNPLRRRRVSVAKIMQKLARMALRRKREVPLPNSERFARDVGISPAEFERLHLRLPSETIRHPNL